MMKARAIKKPKFYGVIIAVPLNWDFPGHLLRRSSLLSRFFFFLPPGRGYNLITSYQVKESNSYTPQGSVHPILGHTLEYAGIIFFILHLFLFFNYI